MTKVVLHGILAQEFKKTFNLSINRPKEVFEAIECNCKNFRNRIVDLANQGIHFSLLINGKKITTVEELSIGLEDQQIDIVPLICGQGGAFVAGVIIAAKAVGAFIAANASFFIGIGMMALQMALAPKPEMKRPESTVSSAKQSFTFSSKANVAEQGIPVPVGYGRLRVGSVIIQSTVRSYPQSFEKDLSLASDGQVQNNNKFSQ